jgi:dephospho-CoA kinase
LETKIYVAGKICSGKSTLARKISEHTGYPLISFGGILKDHLVKSDPPVTRGGLQLIGQELINQLGYEGFLRWSIEHSPQIQWDHSLVVDGLRHGVIYNHLVERFPHNVLVYCVCDQETQIARLIVRDQISEDEAREILSHETEQYVSELESHAHLFFRPEDSVMDFLDQLDVFVRQQP